MIRSSGHLNPGAAGVSFQRSDLGLETLVRHVWIVRWNLPVGQSRPQRVLTYPAANIVITPDEAALHGPDPSIQVRELTGCSWVVGVLLRPAGLPALTTTSPAQLVSSSEPLSSVPWQALTTSMTGGEQATSEVLGILSDWLSPFAETIGRAGLLVNEVSRIVEEEKPLRVAGLAERLGIAERTLHRLVREHTGLTPKWLIECRRLQEAATTLFTTPTTDLAALAAELGYADQAHLTRRYREVLGETPDQTRRAGQSAR